MNTHARRGGAGFSFVELLVTIIIAGIAFAAMVPLFVQAQKATGADKARTTATNIAQDKIEKVRQLDYGDISEANLNSPTFWGSSFGNTVRITGEGATYKDYSVTYDVDPDPTEDPGASSRTVTVTASWTAPPSPVKPAVLRTVIYQQWAGPQLLALQFPDTYAVTDGSDFTGVGGFDWSFEEWFSASSSPTLRIRAMLNPADLAQMRSPSGTILGRVLFGITSAQGGVVPTTAVKTPESSASPSNTYYTFSWDTTGRSDGVYAVSATAVSYNGYQGNTRTTSVRIERGPPLAPTNLRKGEADKRVILLWDTAGRPVDFHHYEVWRAGPIDPADPTILPEPVRVYGDPSSGTAFTSGVFTDTDVINDRLYRYYIYAVDEVGFIISPSSTNDYVGAPAVIEAMPSSSASPPQPLPPGNLNGTDEYLYANLAWTASPSAGVLGYGVYRWGLAEPIAVVAAAETSTRITQGWDRTEWYQVRALQVGLPSDLASLAPAAPFDVMDDGTTWLRVVTDPRVVFRLAVDNDFNANASVELWYLGFDGRSGSVSLGSVAVSRRSTKMDAWTGLDPGVYAIHWLYSDAKATSGGAQFTLTGSASDRTYAIDGPDGELQ